MLAFTTRYSIVVVYAHGVHVASVWFSCPDKIYICSYYTFNMSEKIFHGSPRPFDAETANPKLNQRHNEEGELIFNEESFHATPHKWIALAYTYTSKKIEGLPDNAYYSMGVDLYSDKKEVAIFGTESLEDSLTELYGAGGYVYHFHNGDFVYKDGLGSQEVVASSPTTPLEMERVEDPVSELLSMGVAFNFYDLSLPENQDYLD